MNVSSPLYKDIRVRLDYMNVDIGGYIGKVQAISVKYCVLKHAYLKYKKYFTIQRFKKDFIFIFNTMDFDNWSLVFICYKYKPY